MGRFALDHILYFCAKYNDFISAKLWFCVHTSGMLGIFGLVMGAIFWQFILSNMSHYMRIISSNCRPS